MSLLLVALWLAGAMQLIIAAANFIVAQRLDYASNLRSLPPILRQVFFVHAAYIVAIIIGFALFSLLFAPRLISGDPAMRAIAGGIAAFWGVRVLIHLTVYDKEVRRRYRLEDLAFLLACTTLAIIFLVAALQ